jgi:hypothetical protein
MLFETLYPSQHKPTADAAAAAHYAGSACADIALLRMAYHQLLANTPATEVNDNGTLAAIRFRLIDAGELT